MSPGTEPSDDPQPSTIRKAAVALGVGPGATVGRNLCTGVGVVSTETSAKSLKISDAILDKSANASQTVYVNKTGSQSYVISGWVKANAVPDTVMVRSSPAYDTRKQFGIRAKVTYSDSSVEYFYVPFNADITDWQYASLTVKPSSTTKKVSWITVYSS